MFQSNRTLLTYSFSQSSRIFLQVERASRILFPVRIMLLQNGIEKTRRLTNVFITLYLWTAQCWINRSCKSSRQYYKKKIIIMRFNWIPFLREIYFSLIHLQLHSFRCLHCFTSVQALNLPQNGKLSIPQKNCRIAPIWAHYRVDQCLLSSVAM